MFKCKSCLSKEQHILDLRAQIQDLRTLTYPKQRTEALPPDNVIEADAMLSGHQDKIEDQTPPSDEVFEIAMERDRILSGNY